MGDIYTVETSYTFARRSEQRLCESSLTMTYSQESSFIGGTGFGMVSRVQIP